MIAPVDRLDAGKVPWDLIAEKVGGALPPEVLLGPAVGEDAAVLRLGGELWAVACDPISFTSADAGRLAVLVNANDVAVAGAKPLFFLAVVLLAPGEATGARVDELLSQVCQACRSLDVALIGGHTEVTPGLSHSLVVGTMLGRVIHRPLRSAGLRPGDRVGMTKWAGLEGTSILLAEHGERFCCLHGPRAFRSPCDILAGEWLLVVQEALTAAGHPPVSALHDVTEGGVAEALYELSRASGLELEVRAEGIPVLPETRLVCADLQMNPLGLIGSGSLLVGCGEEGVQGLEAAYREKGVPFAWIGRAGARRPGGLAPLGRFPRDEILKAQLLGEIEAVIFDLDGTVVESSYDWAEVRRRLGVTEPSILDYLAALAGPERDEKWGVLREIERRATEEATLAPGAGEVLALLRRRSIRSALVTNNSGENTQLLLERFGLSFDVVQTRDSGHWKPSPAPLSRVMQRLEVDPESCLAVGDSTLDVLAARDAGCGRIFALRGGSGEGQAGVDLAFGDLEELQRYLEVVL